MLEEPLNPLELLVAETGMPTGEAILDLSKGPCVLFEHDHTGPALSEDVRNLGARDRAAHDGDGVVGGEFIAHGARTISKPSDLEYSTGDLRVSGLRERACSGRVRAFVLVAPAAPERLVQALLRSPIDLVTESIFDLLGLVLGFLA